LIREDAIRELRKLKSVIGEASDKTTVWISDDTFEVYRHGYLTATYYAARLPALTRNAEGRLVEDYMIKSR